MEETQVPKVSQQTRVTHWRDPQAGMYADLGQRWTEARLLGAELSSERGWMGSKRARRCRSSNACSPKISPDSLNESSDGLWQTQLMFWLAQVSVCA